MNWGNSLIFGDKLFRPLLSKLEEFFYWLGTLLWGIFYKIWSMLAWLVDGIEGIFRNLAGIGTTGNDMVSTIIGGYIDKNGKTVNPVGEIFRNLVALSIALIVFFTIVKIIQDHYKDKAGGNPYQTVLRTFKGLLMFFFVTTAVSVGLYASGVVFKALDAATGSGSASISGQIFKAMAADANRKRIGRVSDGVTKDVKNMYYNRLYDGDTENEDGRYFVVEMKGGANSGTQALKDAYYRAFPDLQYGIVNEDGSVTPISNWLGKGGNSLSTRASWDEFKDYSEDYWSNFEGSLIANPYENQVWNGSSAKGSVGYKNDLLAGVSLGIRPSINLTWSPLDILNFEYHLYQVDERNYHKDWNVAGTSVISIDWGYRYGQYMKGEKVLKSLEDSAKVFGFSASGGVALQDSVASTKWSLSTFDTEMFMPLITSILLNVVYTNVLERVIGKLPRFIYQFYFGPADIQLIPTLSPLLKQLLEDFKNSPMFEDMWDVDGKLDEDVDENSRKYLNDVTEIMRSKMLSFGNTNSNSGIWVNVNIDSPSVDIGIEQYRVDGNFGQLWSQLTQQGKDFLKQLENTAAAGLDQASGNIALINDFNSQVQGQLGWMEYAGNVNTYNDSAKTGLNKLGNLLRLYDDVHDGRFNGAFASPVDESALSALNEYLNSDSVGFNGNYYKLEDDIESTFVGLVNRYNTLSKKPGDTKANCVVSRSIYKPIVELNFSDKYAATVSAGEVKDILINKDNKWKNVKVNMYIDENAGSIYRNVDWSAYGDVYGKNNILKNCADIYATTNYRQTITGKKDENNENIAIADETKDENTVVYYRFPTVGSNWDEKVGISYFTDSSLGTGAYNEFYNHASNSSHTTSQYQIKEGCWSNKGVYIGNDLLEGMYEYGSDI
ncbi:MAG: hypothetical protein J5598_01445, partial [Clostridia bacterium]|nr:hypothetical protein [Clostridia bacterium]